MILPAEGQFHQYTKRRALPTNTDADAAFSRVSLRLSRLEACTGGPPVAVLPVAHWTFPENRTVCRQYHHVYTGSGRNTPIRSVRCPYGVPRLPCAAVHVRCPTHRSDSAFNSRGSSGSGGRAPSSATGGDSARFPRSFRHDATTGPGVRCGSVRERSVKPRSATGRRDSAARAGPDGQRRF